MNESKYIESKINSMMIVYDVNTKQKQPFFSYFSFLFFFFYFIYCLFLSVLFYHIVVFVYIIFYDFRTFRNSSLVCVQVQTHKNNTIQYEKHRHRKRMHNRAERKYDPYDENVYIYVQRVEKVLHERER